MLTLKENYDDCPACRKAFTAATEMLAVSASRLIYKGRWLTFFKYKCRRIARRASKVP